MESRLIIRYSIYFITLFLLQILLFNFVLIGTDLFPFVFLLIIILLPVETERLTVLLIAFAMGLFLDFASDTVAIQTAAILFAAFIRPGVLSILSPSDGYEPGKLPSIKNFSLSWFAYYSAIIIFADNFIYYFFKAFSLSAIGTVFLKTLINTAFTTIFIVLMHIIFYRNK
jgi:hypothetical protein